MYTLHTLQYNIQSFILFLIICFNNLPSPILFIHLQIIVAIVIFNIFVV